MFSHAIKKSAPLCEDIHKKYIFIKHESKQPSQVVPGQAGCEQKGPHNILVCFGVTWFGAYDGLCFVASCNRMSWCEVDVSKWWGLIVSKWSFKQKPNILDKKIHSEVQGLVHGTTNQEILSCIPYLFYITTPTIAHNTKLCQFCSDQQAPVLSSITSQALTLWCKIVLQHYSKLKSAHPIVSVHSQYHFAFKSTTLKIPWS